MLKEMLKEEMQKVTVMLPKSLVDSATQSTGLGITPVIRQGLENVIAAQSLKRLRSRRGKVRFTINVNELRKDRD
jgi:hypothetical protein